MRIMNVSGQTRIQVMDVIDQMARWYAKKDAEQLLTIFDEDFCGCGSGPDAVIRGKDQFRAQIKRDFA